MATYCSEMSVNEHLLVWPTPISDKVANIFTMTFVNLLPLLKYVSENIIKTDAFHLIIPLNCLEQLLNDPVYKYPQVQHIYVYYDDIYDLIEIQRRFKFKCGRLQFCSVYDLPRRLESIELDNALISSDPFDRNTINALISSIQDRISAKRLINSPRYSQLLKQINFNLLFGFPVENMNDINSCYICSSCKMVFPQLYQLECKHRKCMICLNIQKSCGICSTVISCDKVWFDQNRFISMKNLRISCIICQWKGLLEAYHEHLNQNHHQLFTCFVHNLQVDNYNFDQFSPIEINRQTFLHHSFDGTCIWEVSGIDAMINNGVTDGRNSFYSSPFYTYPSGYKMCLRIFLNGDAKARNTHISLFIVLMRGDYDENLKWPFKFKTIFTLLNNLLPEHNQSSSFWPKTTSSSFQRPISNMNIAYGFSKFVSLEVLKNNRNQYIQNGSMFIKTEIDFLADQSSSLMIPDVGELSNEEEYADQNYDNLQHLLCHRNPSV